MTRFVNFCATCMVGVFMATSMTVPMALATTASDDAVAPVSTAADLETLRQRGETIFYGLGGAEPDVVRGLAVMRQAADGGDVRAKAAVGKILLEGYYVPAAPAEGRRMLQEAVQSGNSSAMATLGLAGLWGLYGETRNPNAARSLLEQAAAQNEGDALWILGEQLIVGEIYEAEPERGLDLIERAIKAENPRAKIALGGLLLDGIYLPRDSERARTLFEAAAKQGDGQGLERLGAHLMWNRISYRRGEDYLRRAGELGRSTAWTSLAEGAMYAYLGKRSRAKFNGYAAKARAAGDHRIEVLEANRRIWGISMRASGPKAIAGLEQAADAGNAHAARFLISLVRDGNYWNVRRRPNNAVAYLERYQDLLTPMEQEQLALSIEIAKARSPAQFKQLSEVFFAHPEYKSRWFGQEIYKANPNFAMYVLQIEMRDKGLYSGSLNGLATRSTLRSLWRTCNRMGDRRRCNDTVMHPSVISALLSR